MLVKAQLLHPPPECSLLYVECWTDGCGSQRGTKEGRALLIWDGHWDYITELIDGSPDVPPGCG